MRAITLDGKDYTLDEEGVWAGPVKPLVNMLNDRANRILDDPDLSPAHGDPLSRVFNDAVAWFEPEQSINNTKREPTIPGTVQ